MFNSEKVTVKKSDLKAVQEKQAKRDKEISEKYNFYKKFYKDTFPVVEKTIQAMAENKQLKQENKAMKTKLQKIDESVLENMRHIPIKTVLENRGYKLAQEGQFYRVKTDKLNLVINPADNTFFDNKAQKKGFGAINIMTNVEGFKFREATEYLAEHYGSDKVAKEVLNHPNLKVSAQSLVISNLTKTLSEVPKSDKEALPEVVKHLTKTRKLDPVLVKEMTDAGQIYAEKRNDRVNAVFSNPENSYAFVRGITSIKFTQSRGQMDFIKTQNTPEPKKIYLFESPIDMLSYRTLYPEKQGQFVSLQGSSMTGKIEELKLNSFEKVVCCFDNDRQGKVFAEKVKSICPTAEVHTPSSKDFNQDLITNSQTVKYGLPEPLIAKMVRENQQASNLKRANLEQASKIQKSLEDAKKAQELIKNRNRGLGRSM